MLQCYMQLEKTEESSVKLPTGILVADCESVPGLLKVT
jgi:hypothetical protein